MLNVFPIPIYQDNYVWIIQKGDVCWIVDPGYAPPVLHALEHMKLTPQAILLTHRHWDHISGVEAITNKYSIPVYGPKYFGMEQVNTPIKQGSKLMFCGHTVDVFEYPGHTNEHIAYHFPEDNLLFSGDTIFSAGCGRLLGGKIEDLYDSFNKIKTLGNPTIYATHEYTLSNLAFAQTVEPNNSHIRSHFLRCKGLRAANQPTLPTQLNTEKCINPFLRCHKSGVIKAAEAYAKRSLTSEFDVFKVLRQWKDVF